MWLWHYWLKDRLMKQRFSSQSFSATIYKEQKEIYLFCKADAILDCQNIHNTIFESIQDNETYKDITLQDLYDYTIQVFLDSILLLGSKESPNNPLFFGELDSKGEFIESKPVYHLQASDEIIESTSHNRDSSNADSNNSLSTLQIFLNDSTLTLLNYSLLDSSLNIKLECNSSESKEILEREKTQRDCHEANASANDNPQSTAMLYPIPEDSEKLCYNINLASEKEYNVVI